MVCFDGGELPQSSWSFVVYIFVKNVYNNRLFPKDPFET